MRLRRCVRPTPGYEWLEGEVLAGGEHRQSQLRAFVALANEMSMTPAQLSIAWCLHNPQVSSVILGATRPAQLAENLATMELVERVDEDVVRRAEALFAQ